MSTCSIDTKLVRQMKARVVIGKSKPSMAEVIIGKNRGEESGVLSIRAKNKSCEILVTVTNISSSANLSEFKAADGNRRARLQMMILPGPGSRKQNLTIEMRLEDMVLFKTVFQQTFRSVLIRSRSSNTGEENNTSKINKKRGADTVDEDQNEDLPPNKRARKAVF